MKESVLSEDQWERMGNVAVDVERVIACETADLAAAAEIPERNVLDSLTSPRAPVKILRAEQIDAYCPPDRLSEVAAFESELKDTGKSIV